MAKNFQYAFLDSGTGGLPYLHQLRVQAPTASCVYVADTEHFPYGEKTKDEVIKFAIEVVDKIINRLKPEIIIVACNTISVVALEALRKSFDLPFVGTVPAIKTAAKKTKNKKIGLLATERTVEDEYTDDLVNQFASESTIIKIGESKLISRIEKDLVVASKKERLDAVRTSIETFKKENVDTIVLACTHFLHVIDEIKEVAGDKIEVIDSREGVVQQALRIVNPWGINDSESFCYITGGVDFCEEKRYQNYAELFDIKWGGLL